LDFDPLRLVFVLVPMILSLTVHEYFHAWMALKLGDDTAYQAGRLTLNPLAHIDPIGTLLLPIIGLTTGAPFFGWAKPVPVSPLRFTRSLRLRTGVMLTSAAGPLSNLLFALVLAAVLSVIARIIGMEQLFDSLQRNQGISVAIVRLLGWTILINIGLFVFNLIPIPPLDGSGVLAGLIPDSKLYILDFLARYSFILFIVVLLLGGKFIGYPVRWIVEGISLLTGFPIWLAFYGA